ncbi:hypothetical protein A3J20_02400 [Candidatus Gottesmanbacteria bacterium RIFCSPLOWO2_02_FULL_42_29]|uniref:PIN domain-containing protein n=1 Tax=Candidatus Gottesmanbacteria bacterium RIFCSPLOWO2_01_FULL_42_22 TaxID=1798391 RepID=A0A1F6BBF6_9BACT|nr:MAG: hypothetical protein A2781_04065 [Candidatus Gottesmanbacteria bacterium RIFCSPHIGHO2_01_FULL_42_27]OGG19702.1 MAG: hypothetical protein A3E72_06320 [Candidatus Gottesmanbacteria bacterium RIFCSPHIGHO2_12_FULL_43_26]OGG34133.1 MAG: hypothetical protein A2968_03090 [Candidatus Gottesmanbacteria bacterium RIFCSPLOWO2_01_FULL_42_22]OGG37909.1 MAG: hypothetical protein A3J20_02400 [Candidatus Gottesmanbacteria bacterium RIFCSPLOWO2_02_FULL_42_29]
MAIPTIIVGDADGLIALFNKEDNHSSEAFSILEKLINSGGGIIYPVTAITEAITTLQRKLNKPVLAGVIAKQVKESKLTVETVDQGVLEQAANLFDPGGSKQNTLFDAIVAAVAKKYSIDTIFSFDNWYKKQGFKLAGSLF